MRTSYQSINNEKKAEVKIPSEITASKVLKRVEPFETKGIRKRGNPVRDLTNPYVRNIETNKQAESVLKSEYAKVTVKSYPAASSMANKLYNSNNRPVESRITKPIDKKTIAHDSPQPKFVRVDQKTNNTFITVKALASLQSNQSQTVGASALNKPMSQANKLSRTLTISSLPPSSSLLTVNQPQSNVTLKPRPNKTPIRLSEIQIQQNLIKSLTEQTKNFNQRTLDRTRLIPRRTDQRAKSMHYNFDAKRITKATLDSDWNSLTEALSSSAAQIKIPPQQQKIVDVADVCIDLAKLTREQLNPRPQQVPARTIRRSLTKTKSTSTMDGEPAEKAGRLSLPFLDDLGNVIQWNRQSRNGSLPQSIVAFERNEFGMVEMNPNDKHTRNEPASNRGRTANRRKSILSASCNHNNFTDCFNAIIARFGKNLRLNQAFAIEHSSKEFKALIRECIQNRNQRCHAVTFVEIQDAISKSPHFGAGKLEKKFNWELYLQQYLKRTGTQLPVAPSNYFFNSSTNDTNRFIIGHKLEAIDPLNCLLYCVCTVVGVRGHRIKLHFDGYHSAYDFWTNINSKEIFPVSHCARTARKLEPPYGQDKFNWIDYLARTNSVAAPPSCFKQLDFLVSYS